MYDNPLWDAYWIRPIIHLKQMRWKEKIMPGYNPTATLTRALFEHRARNIDYDKSVQLREMYFHGFEERRNTLKYRCPAALYDLQCEGWQ